MELDQTALFLISKMHFHATIFVERKIYLLTTNLASHEQKYCQRCNATFECKVGTINLCQCSQIDLNETTKAYLQQNYKDCICITCLKEIQEILFVNQWNKMS